MSTTELRSDWMIGYYTRNIAKIRKYIGEESAKIAIYSKHSSPSCYTY